MTISVPQGVRVAVAGKTHVRQTAPDWRIRGSLPTPKSARALRKGPSEPFERDDGLHPPGLGQSGLSYTRWLAAQGDMTGRILNDRANAATGPNGEILSGWNLKNSDLSRRVREEHSEHRLTSRTEASSSSKIARTSPGSCICSYIKTALALYRTRSLSMRCSRRIRYAGRSSRTGS